jgi:hypothetical protein
MGARSTGAATTREWLDLVVLEMQAMQRMLVDLSKH